jgi:hypothetical protein
MRCTKHTRPIAATRPSRALSAELSLLVLPWANAKSGVARAADVGDQPDDNQQRADDYRRPGADAEQIVGGVREARCESALSSSTTCLEVDQCLPSQFASN